MRCCGAAADGGIVVLLSSSESPSTFTKVDGSFEAIFATKQEQNGAKYRTRKAMPSKIWKVIGQNLPAKYRSAPSKFGLGLLCGPRLHVHVHS